MPRSRVEIADTNSGSPEGSSAQAAAVEVLVDVHGHDDQRIALRGQRDPVVAVAAHAGVRDPLARSLRRALQELLEARCTSPGPDPRPRPTIRDPRP